MKVEPLRLAGLKLVRPQVFADERGFFLEGFHASRYAEHGIDCAFVQDNHSRSRRGTLRGLHYQATATLGAPALVTAGQAKLVRVARGTIFDVAVDIRPGSPTFGQWEGVELDDRDHAQLFVPVGFAHGFCVISETADVIYKVSSPYVAEAERSIAWNDPEIGVAWPVADPIVSARDREAEPLSSYRARISS